MFQAILKSKVRGLLQDAGMAPGMNWRRLIGQTEDFLTAAVFARLSYLPAAVFWRIIRTSAVVVSPDATFPETPGPLTARPEFWPRWRLKLVDQRDHLREPVPVEREPDAFLQFEHLRLVVEAKRDDGVGQSADQWAAEIAACLQTEEEGLEIDRPVWLLAVGGIEEARLLYPEALKLFRDRYGYVGRPLLVVACSWIRLLEGIIEAENSAEAEQEPDELKRGTDCILQDLKAILGFYGFRKNCWVTDLASLDVMSLRPIREHSLKAFVKWEAEKTGAAASCAQWWDGSSAFRNIEEHSLRTMVEVRA